MAPIGSAEPTKAGEQSPPAAVRFLVGVRNSGRLGVGDWLGQPTSRSKVRAGVEEAWTSLFNPLVRLCVRHTVRPDLISLASVLSVGAAALLLGAGAFALGGWLYLLGASLDFVDGRVARATLTTTRAGAFLDSMLDRVGELLVFGALAIRLRDTPFLVFVLVAGAAAVLVSYARARGEGLGAGPSSRRGLMQRPERVAATALPCVLAPLADALYGLGAGQTLVGASLAVLAVFSVVTVANRGIFTYRALREAEEAKGERGEEPRLP
jgi:CDP-diacylglycerol---glycerol-3-phosphate 3-phosphatidyltransferase